MPLDIRVPRTGWTLNRNVLYKACTDTHLKVSVTYMTLFSSSKTRFMHFWSFFGFLQNSYQFFPDIFSSTCKENKNCYLQYQISTYAFTWGLVCSSAFLVPKIKNTNGEWSAVLPQQFPYQWVVSLVRVHLDLWLAAASSETDAFSRPNFLRSLLVHWDGVNAHKITRSDQLKCCIFKIWIPILDTLFRKMWHWVWHCLASNGRAISPLTLPSE